MPTDWSADESAPYAPLIRALARDESLTQGLGDIEARMLIDWAAGWAELLARAAPDGDKAAHLVARVRRRAGTVGRFVQLWSRPRTRAAACQLAAAERVTWPLPAGRVDPADLMHAVLSWERPDGSRGWGEPRAPGQDCGPRPS